MATRKRRAEDLTSDALGALLDTIDRLEVDGLDASVDEELSRAHLELPHTSVTLAVAAAACATPDLVRRKVTEPSSGFPHIMVADTIPAASRRILEEHGWNWLDRHDRLRLRLPSLIVDVDLEAEPSAPTAHRNPISGATALGIAVTALVNAPDPVPGVRALARELAVNPGGTSTQARRLVEAGLLTSDRRAAIPDLFWAVADHWAHEWTALTSPVTDLSGMIEVGSTAAADAGAPIVLSKDYPRRYIAREAADVRRVRRQAGVAEGGHLPVAYIAPALTRAEFAEADGVHAHPAILALHLATEGERAVESLENWDTPHRVW